MLDLYVDTTISSTASILQQAAAVGGIYGGIYVRIPPYHLSPVLCIKHTTKHVNAHTKAPDYQVYRFVDVYHQH